MWNGYVLPFEFFSRDDMNGLPFACKLAAELNFNAIQVNGYVR